LFGWLVGTGEGTMSSLQNPVIIQQDAVTVVLPWSRSGSSVPQHISLSSNNTDNDKMMKNTSSICTVTKDEVVEQRLNHPSPAVMNDMNEDNDMLMMAEEEEEEEVMLEKEEEVMVEKEEEEEVIVEKEEDKNKKTKHNEYTSCSLLTIPKKRTKVSTADLLTAATDDTDDTHTIGDPGPITIKLPVTVCTGKMNKKKSWNRERTKQKGKKLKITGVAMINNNNKAVSNSDIATLPIESFAKCQDADVILQFDLGKGHEGNKAYWDKSVELLPLWENVVNDKEGQNQLVQRLVDYIEKDIGGRFVEGGGIGFVVVEERKKLAKVKKMIKDKFIRTFQKQNPTDDNVVVNSLYEDFVSPSCMKTVAAISTKQDMIANQWTTRENHQKSREEKKVIKKNKKKKRKRKIEDDTTVESPTPKQGRNIPQLSVKRSTKQYIYEVDPNQYYVEETAHIYHDPPQPGNSEGVTPLQLKPIPPPPPLPALPNTGSCYWSFYEENRVMIADFSIGADETIIMLEEDTKFLFEMQERDDITLVTRGLLNFSSLDHSLWNLNYLATTRGEEFFHKFRRFDRTMDENGYETYTEKDYLYSMRFKEFVRYCTMRKSYLQETTISSNTAAQQEPQFTFVDHQDKQHTLGVWSCALYMIDLDMKRLFPKLYDNFLDCFQLPAVLPGGMNCMMNHVTSSARPIMGPNLYVTPPASFTQFHQDGHGTVDSGHLCIHGYNEVVILRRLTERHKKHALWILSGSKTDSSHWDGLYKEPHGDGLGEKPNWATKEMVAECKRMGYVL
jgi:hypothetical protein